MLNQTEIDEPIISQDSEVGIAIQEPDLTDLIVDPVIASQIDAGDGIDELPPGDEEAQLTVPQHRMPPSFEQIGDIPSVAGFDLRHLEALRSSEVKSVLLPMDRVDILSLQEVEEEQLHDDLTPNEDDDWLYEVIPVEPLVNRPPSPPDTSQATLRVPLLSPPSLTVDASLYLRNVREQLLGVRPTTPNGFRDIHGFIVDYENDQPTTLGEGTLHAAIAAVAIATGNYTQDAWEKNEANRYLEELLTTLLDKSWGNRDGLGREHPIRHPDVYDYDAGGSVLRNSPLTKDSFGAILAAAYYASKGPHNSSKAKSLAKDLITKWVEYLVINQWRTHSSYIAGEFESEEIDSKKYYKHIFSEGGKRTQYKGPEAFILLPHEIYALQNVAAELGIPTTHWNVWSNGMSAALKQTLTDIVAPYLANLAAHGLEAILQRLSFSIPYSIPLGPSHWSLGKVTGNFSVSIPRKTKEGIVNAFELAVRDIIREYVRLEVLGTNQAGELLGLVINRILDFLPDELGKEKWREIITSALQQFVPWLTGSAWVEMATFMATLQLLKTNAPPLSAGPDVVSYSVWSFAVEFESRPEMAAVLKPLVQEFFSYLRGNNNPNGLWAWLAEDSGRIQQQLTLFESNPLDRWPNFAYGSTKFNEWETQPENPDKQSPRLDYLILHGLAEMGYPSSVFDYITDWWEKFVKAVRDALAHFVQLIIDQFKNIGTYAREWVDQAGNLIREVWNQAGEYIREVFHVGIRINRFSSILDGAAEQWRWNINGALETYHKWKRVLSNGTVATADLLERLIRDAQGQLQKWLWGTDGVFQAYYKWWRSGPLGAAVGTDLVEQLLRDAQGQLQKWLWGTDGVFQAYYKWWRSTVSGGAAGIDLLEKKLRNAQGQLEQWLYDVNGVFKSYGKWWRSSLLGGATSNDMIEKITRNVQGQIEKWLWGTNGVFKEYYKWWRSTIGGGAAAADLVEKRLRSVQGQLEKWLWGTNGVFQESYKWWRSTTLGAAAGADLVEKFVRTAQGQLEKWLWGTNGVFKEYYKWWRSTTLGGAAGADLVEKRVRTARGQLEKWLWGTNGVFKEYYKWWRSTTLGGAAGADLVEKQLRNAQGQLEEWLWGTNGVFKEYRKWWRSTKAGGAVGADLVEKRLRSAKGQLEKWIWGKNGVFQTYHLWSKSTVLGAANGADLIKRLTQEANGNMIVETWNAAGKYAKTIFNAAGDVIGGINIPLPEWPPKW